MDFWKYFARSRQTQLANSHGIQLSSFIRQNGSEKAHIHLRIDTDGSGLLIINANSVIHLNPSAASMALLALQDTPKAQAVHELKRIFSISTRKLSDDYTQFVSQLNELIDPNGACPIHALNLETIPPFTSKPSAPYRMDLALTYRCNNDCLHCYNARPRDFSEISTDFWKKIINKIWEIGIPHLVFTGGEPTLRSDLPELISYAQHIGLITGLNTNGRLLNKPDYLDTLVSSGLDHVQITIESHDPEIHDQMVRARGAWAQTVAGIRNALDTPLYVMTNSTMLRQNSPALNQTLHFLAKLGVPTIGLNALIFSGQGATCGSGLHEAELRPILELARNMTEQHHQRLIWYTPTQYCNFDPMELELGVKGCTAARYNMCIEPDGAVIPCQSFYFPLGSMLNDPWDSIWEHDLAKQLRNRQERQEKCNSCLLFSECGGGCPLSSTHITNKKE